MSDATRVPRLDLEPRLADIRPEIDAAIARVLDGGRFVLGPEVEAFEAAFAAHSRARFAVGCASGTDALLLSLMSLGIGPGDQVICPAYTFFATAGAIARVGAEPVFADIAPDSLTLDPSSVAAVAKDCSSLRAIVVVHLFGRTANSEALRAIAKAHDAVLIHDAAQAVGALDEAGDPPGASGELSAFSFYPSKNLGAFGDAGAVTTSDPEQAARLRALRVHGAKAPYQHEWIGMNSRLDELQAAVLNVRLRHLEADLRERRDAASDYDAKLADCSELVRPARPAAETNGRHGFHQYAIRVPAERRDALADFLRERGIESSIYYAVPLHRQPCFAGEPRAGFGHTLPESDAASRETLALPIYPGLRAEDLAAVASSTCAFFSGVTPQRAS